MTPTPGPTRLLAAPIALALALVLSACAASLPKNPDDMNFEQAKGEYERLKAGMGAKESDALFGACSKSASNRMSGRNSLNEYMLPTYICYIKGAQ
jgi:hypothetical protein